MTRNSMKLVFAPAVAAATLTFACVDKEQCEEAIRVTRDALAKDQPEVARQWRDRAWKMCGDEATTSTLDREILDKEAAIKKQAEDDAKRVADAAQSRMNAAKRLWKAFDKLSEKKQTLAQLELYREKAYEMKNGLPEEYAKQVAESNEKAYAARKKRVESLQAKK